MQTRPHLPHSHTMEFDLLMMGRALELAARGRGHVAPNPMVGAVITAPDGRIIGQGWHRRYGGPHAEVNAVASVARADRHLLPMSTIYVTLEPCSHYGKTPPCAGLLVRERFSRVVIAAGDPNPKVNGRGIAMLAEAGIKVDCGICATKAECLNHQFFTAHRLHRPFITLKMARSADGFMDCRRTACQPAARFSNSLTTLTTMALRASHQAILTTAATIAADNPSMNLRHYPGNQPRLVIIDRHKRLSGAERVFRIHHDPIIIDSGDSLISIMEGLYANAGITSVLVEAGPSLLGAFLEENLWDAMRVETSPCPLGDCGTHPAPALPATASASHAELDGNAIDWYSNNLLFRPQPHTQH